MQGQWVGPDCSCLLQCSWRVKPEEKGSRAHSAALGTPEVGCNYPGVGLLHPDMMCLIKAGCQQTETATSHGPLPGPLNPSSWFMPPDRNLPTTLLQTMIPFPVWG